MAAQANTVGTQNKGFLQWARSRKGQQAIIIVAFMVFPLAQENLWAGKITPVYSAEKIVSAR